MSNISVFSDLYEGLDQNEWMYLNQARAITKMILGKYNIYYPEMYLIDAHLSDKRGKFSKPFGGLSVFTTPNSGFLLKIASIHNGALAEELWTPYGVYKISNGGHSNVNTVKALLKELNEMLNLKLVVEEMNPCINELDMASLYSINLDVLPKVDITTMRERGCW